MLFNCFDDIDLDLLDTFESEEELLSYLTNKYWLDVAEKIEEIITYDSNGIGLRNYLMECKMFLYKIPCN